MQWQSFKVQYLTMVEKFGKNVFSENDVMRVWEHFVTLPENIAVNVFKHVHSEHKPSFPATVEILINTAKRAKFQVEQKAEAEKEFSWDQVNPNSIDEALKQSGFTGREEFLARLAGRKPDSDTNK